MVSTTRPATRARPHGPRVDATVAFLAASAYLAMLAWGMANLSFDIWGAMVVGPVLVAISAPLLAAAIRREADPRMAKTRGKEEHDAADVAHRTTRNSPIFHGRLVVGLGPLTHRGEPHRCASPPSPQPPSTPHPDSSLTPRLIEASIDLDHLILPDGRLATSDVSGGEVKRRFVRRDARCERVSCDGPRRGRPGAPCPPTIVRSSRTIIVDVRPTIV